MEQFIFRRAPLGLYPSGKDLAVSRVPHLCEWSITTLQYLAITTLVGARAILVLSDDFYIHSSTAIRCWFYGTIRCKCDYLVDSQCLWTLLFSVWFHWLFSISPLLFGASIFAWALITDSGHSWDYCLWATLYSFGYADDMRRFYLFYTLVLISLWRFLLFIDD